MVTRGSKKTYPKKNPTPDALFEVDTKGSESIRHSFLHGSAAARARKGVKPLKADEILSEVSRSQTPAICGRTRASVSKNANPNRKVRLMSREERERLHKIVLRKKQSSSLIDENRSSTAVAIRPPCPPQGDVWNSATSSAGETTSVPTVKPPPHLRHNDLIETVTSSLTTPLSMAPGLAAIPHPHPGQSYNPTFKDHQEVLNLALEELEEEKRDADRVKEVKDRMDKSLAEARAKEQWEFCQEEVEKIEEDENAEVEALTNPDEAFVKKTKKAKKKTTAQRNRKAKAMEEARMLLKRRQAKLISKSLHELPTIVNSLSIEKAASLQSQLARKSQRATLVSKYGLTAVRGGKPKGLNAISDQRTYQLTQDLTESGLRGLKPEGNLWKDWQLSGMRRGKLAQKAVVGPLKGQRTGKGRKFKEVEKHAWKNFEA
ncbi:hypothetical protein CROQUDRAFT_657708 [Cronartium quercuum f. sp. fusiforme G11]|uniref:Ribosome biogenesis protein NOP53 n=1 Tax=Cronartium quercuum f. sp. fusiforme G11 TaxID=708437 RepID=A0A9P6NML1_9BASI|nr:hypothetical protein CROQUDRAFT_657708 [Cronartium quercuum f. sp. fusiforme G11]